MALRKRFRQSASGPRTARRQQKRRHLLETLEPRQLLAGPQLIGVQPNQGDLIDDGVVRSVAPRALTFRFDEAQQIDPSTFEGIRITRAGRDGVFGTADDVVVEPGLVTLGDIRQNEVIVRFAENLPDDHYRINVFAFDDPGQGIVALRNVNGEVFVPSEAGSRAETIEFKLNLGALVEAVVPQPVVRLADGSLQQRRDEIVVYFNEDELFVENDPATGLPTARSAENPRFYQLLLTHDTVRTTDDTLYFPERVIYDPATHTARLIFETDINDLPAKDGFAGVPLGGGTFRLRIGTAVDARDDLILEPQRVVPGGQIGDTLGTALNLNNGNQFVTDGSQTSSIIIEGEIVPVPFGIQLPGGANDPGRLNLPEIAGGGLLQTINENFGPDSTEGVTEIAYNFQTVYAAGTGGQSLLNQITDRQRRRVREAVSLWGNYLGVQFRETRNEGITFAVGDPAALPAMGLQMSTPAVRGVLNAAVRIDPSYENSAMVFSNEVQFNTAYGEDFFRKTMAGIGFMLGLEQSTEFTPQSLMALNAAFLNQTINPTLPTGAVNLTQLRDLEPAFPGQLDILHGRHVHRPDSIDVDLYRFVVELGPGNQSGTFTAETFAERLPDSSLLDSALRLFQETRATTETDLGFGSGLLINIEAVQAGSLGNNARIDFIRTGSGSITVRQKNATDGRPIDNAIEVLVPRNSPVTVGELINAINNHSFASTLFRAELQVGSASTQIQNATLDRPLLLSGGGITEMSRNDDYYSNDSFLTASLGNGIYYIGVAASGNDRYNPELTGSGFGGRTQGKYELALKFEPQVSEVDTIRDRDSDRVGVPGTALDGNGDGLPGGVKNFWFQTRAENRLLEVTVNGAAIIPGQTFTLVGANGQSRRFEFVPQGGTPAAGNVAISYSPGAPGTPTPAASLAGAIRSAINTPEVRAALGIEAVAVPDRPTVLELRGERSIRFSDQFRGVTAHGRTLFVDKLGSVNADGSAARPFNNIANPSVPNAFGSASPQDIVRIVGNGGQDGDLSTPEDNFAYKIGTAETGGGMLEDGRNMLVPRDVTVMIDAGAAFKLRNSAIVVGSTSLLNDRSGGVLQVLGTPRLTEISDPVIDSTGVIDVGVDLAGDVGSVFFTSTRDRGVDAAAAGNSPAPSEGNWGGIIFRRDFDESQGRFDLEDEGVFLQTVNHADIRFGGGSNVLIESIQQTVNPIQMVNLRPNVTFNRLSNNAGAAMSASPDSFEETSYQAPRFQQAGEFTADYGRVGPDVRNNLLTNNSINGLFIRAETTPDQPARQLTVAGRFDNIDIVHYVAENIVIAGNPGGSIQDGVRPQLDDVAGVPISGGGVLTAGEYRYQFTFVDRFGFESLAAAAPSGSTTVGNNGAIELFNLPAVPSGGDYINRRLYRQAPGSSEFVLVAELDASSARFLDTGRRSGTALDEARQGVRGRLNASLVIDPGTVVKLGGARIELGHGTQLLAEGVPGLPVVFTSVADDRFGAGGSFDTNNDSGSPGGGIIPAHGDWAGIYAGPTANVSLDNAVVAYGGGLSLVEGGQSKAFNALELHQATARVTDTRFEFNANGQGGAAPVGRNGRLGNTPATIFVRQAQPVLVGNEFLENRGPVIEIDSDSFIADYVVDLGRQTGALERLADLDDNQGPLIRRNAMEATPSDNAALRQLNGMYVRGGLLSTSSVWDDTDIVHMVFDSIVVGNQVSGGELRLQSRPDESLVIKLAGGGNPNSLTAGTGFTATGSRSDLTDRIGGTIQVIGRPGAPVVMTSLLDDTVGAGRRLDGSEQNDTNGDGFGSRPFPNDWRGLVFDEFSNDRNIAVVMEQEVATAVPPGLNATVDNAQFIGELAENFLSGDERFRLGFEVHGFLSGPTDIDVYSFTGAAGTPVWIDIDKTSIALDSVLEILDSSGNVLARSTNSFDEVDDPSLIHIPSGSALAGRAGPLSRFEGAFEERGAFGLYEDFGSTNPRDAGLSVVLPGPAGSRSPYFVRIRSNSVNPDDAAAGMTRGGYTFQVRLQEQQEFPGSTVQFADIRYANHGIRMRGLPSNSPLIGEVGEDEALSPAINNNSFPGGPNVGARPQYVGNLASTRNDAISIAGELSTTADVDFFRLDVFFGGAALSQLQKSTVFDIDYADGFTRPDTNISVFYDDGSGPRLVLFGTGSNIADDQASPLGAEIGELLSRGSVADGDPFIGPVSLPQGSYYIAVTAAGLAPVQLQNNTLLRREPIDSVLRIFDDSVESIGSFGTAGPVMPREGAFVASNDPGWDITTQRATDPGHQRLNTFNGSRQTNVFTAGTPVTVAEPNNTFDTAVDLEQFDWSLAFNPNVGSATANTSDTVPWISAVGNMAGDVVDILRFEVPFNNSQVILDVDGGFNPQNPDGPGSVDLKLQLFRQVIDPDSGEVSFQLINSNSEAPATWGAGGSEPGTAEFPGSVFSADPFIQTTLTAGVYFVAVSPEATTYDAGNNTFNLAPGDRPTTGTYTLQVSVAGHEIAGGDPGNQSWNFDRSTQSGTLRSAEFDLAGYGAADLPRFYFDYFLDAAPQDSVQMRVHSNEQPTPVPLVGVNGQTLTLAPPPEGNQNNWRQGIASLARFAGDTGVVIEFEYTTSDSIVFAEGLYLDNFIVGFAERGEMIIGAQRGATEFAGFGGGTQAGKYQLEVRGASDYGTPVAGGINLDRVYDTNDRFDRSITLVAPAGDQIQNGDRFRLNDGRRTLTFEFNTDTGFIPDIIRIPYDPADSAVQIAQRLINTINSSVVQSTLKIKAAPASSNTSLTTTDPRVNLHGTVIGEFEEIRRVTEAPATLQAEPRPGGGRNVTLAAIRHDLYGDQNVERVQGQFIVDSSTVSYAHGVGIWSELPPRQTDPRDAQAFASAMAPPPIGITDAGAAINFPTLNDAVLGGLSTGAVLSNNIINQAGMAGIKIDGQTRPIMVETPAIFDNETFQTRSIINDGDIFEVDAGGTRVVFEFDDVSGAPVPAGGSGVRGGNGVRDGHIPIYYRHAAGGGQYNFGEGILAASSVHQILVGLAQAINGSKLVTNNQVGFVRAYVAPSLTRPPTTGVFNLPSTPALYIEGASTVRWTRGFSSQLAPIAEAPQPFVRVVNNTIYGSDGTESQFAGTAMDGPNDTIFRAVDTKLGRSHRATYVTQGEIGVNTGPLPAERDVDMFKVELDVGDRLIVDVDTDADGPATVLRLFDERGVPQTFLTAGGTGILSAAGPVPSHLKPGSGINNPLTDDPNARDGFIDFTATRKGTYYVGVSSRGNDTYDPLSLAGRTAGNGGTGEYRLAMEVYAPRDFVLMVNGGRGANAAALSGTRADDLIGTTFTITQVPDFAGSAAINAFGNRVTFEFTNAAGGAILPNGNVNIPLLSDPPAPNGGYRVQEITRAISSAINRVINGLPVMANHFGNNGPEDRNGPVPPIRSLALGGFDGDNPAIQKFFAPPGSPNIDFAPSVIPEGHSRGYGHNRREMNPNVRNFNTAVGGGLSDGNGTSEQYVQIMNAARIELSPEARAAGLRLGPDLSEGQFAGESGQLIAEAGVMITQGASPTLVNNIFMNLHQSVQAEETAAAGFGRRIVQDMFYKGQAIVQTGNVFQYDESRTTRMQSDVASPGSPGGDPAISTDNIVGPSNVSPATDDFNVVISGDVQVLENPAGGRFTPAPFSPVIDSAINSLAERDTFGALKQSVGIALSNILAPDRDHSGQLRADHPDVASSGGLGANVFKDRGALDLADFVGPAATIDFPRDNDAAGIDTDPAESFLNLRSGVYHEFRILLQDLGDASDPFVGSGIDHNTVVVPVIPEVRSAGANVALFEGDQLLTEGVDYTFSYDTTSGMITLRPLAGIWRNDRAYRISINNRDRTVGIAPAAGFVSDGDSFIVRDSTGGRATFEFESGYELRIPEALRFSVPQAGTNAGGITDGSRFSITGVGGNPVFFEFDRDNVTLPGSRVIPFQTGDSPETIAQATVDAINAAVDAGLVDVTPVVDGRHVVIGSEPGVVLNAGQTALTVAPLTLALLVPAVGTGPGGIADGDVVIINDGSRSIRFEFDADGNFSPLNTPVDIAGLTQADSLRDALFDAIDASPLKINPFIVDEFVFLDLPVDGSATVERGALAVVGLSRTLNDGSTITLTSTAGETFTIVLNRTDEDEELPPGDFRIDFDRATTADRLAEKIATAIRSRPLEGLDPSGVFANPGGQVAIGGEPGLQLELDVASTLRIVGEPGVTGPSLLTISGPLIAQLPIVGGSGISDDSQFTITDGINVVTFQYNLVLTGASNPLAVEIPYQNFDDVETIAQATIDAINNSALNVTATNLGGGRISLGNLADGQVTFPEEPQPFTLRRGIVDDGEQVVITQGNQVLRLEFEAATGGGGVEPGFIPVVFQPGSSIEDVAGVLAAAINNNRGSMNLSAQALPGGRVQLADDSRTTVDVSGAPTIALSGTPGGAIPVRFDGAFGSEEMKRALINAINQANQAGLTSLTAENRGGGTLFIENAIFIDGPLESYFLHAVKDLAGNPLKPNREDNTTQFTILMPTVGLDFGDAPDPRGSTPGRYPTLLASDGARHVVDPGGVRLGRLIDVDVDGMPSLMADGDDTTVFVTGSSGPLFDAVIRTGFVEVSFNLDADPATFDGNTVTISTGVDTATLEFDVNGIFNENHFAVSPTDPTSRASIAQAFADAVRESPLRPADVVVVGDQVHIIVDDEDGVTFGGATNPQGIINPGIPLEITVTVTGSGVLEAWIDWNFDGDWDDPNEQIIDASTPGAIFAGDPTGEPITRTFIVNVPANAPRPTVPTLTYARFRISTDGGLTPRGLALSGEVEDYVLTILPGLPPTISNPQLTYRVAEDGILQARDADGTLTPQDPNDDGILATVSDPDGDPVAIFADDVGTRNLFDNAGELAGELTLFADGTFTFLPTPDYFGQTQFTARVTDIKPQAPETQLVSPTPITVTIIVDPVNDPPFVAGPPPIIERTIAEDTVVTFSREELTAFYLPGPPNEADQPLFIQSAGVGGLGFQTQLGGILQIVDGNIRYTPPANFPGPGPDRFNYVVADDPMDPNQISEAAEELGTVIITITPINDPPIVGNNSFDFDGDGPFLIPIGAPSQAGTLLGNDRPGPPDEVAEGQGLQLVANEFPKATLRGGTVRVSSDGQNLIYTPPENFTGPDQFTYTVTDTEPAEHRYNPWIPQTASGTVFLTVGGDNLAPVFVGINGDPNRTSLTFDESKEVEQVFDFNLNTWFVDPEGDVSTFTVVSSDPTVVNASVIEDPATGASTLRLRLPPFRFGEVVLDIVATNVGGGPSTAVQIPVTVINTPDPPVLIGTLDPLNANEDETIVRDLSQVFFDPDGGVLTYSVSRIGNILNPTPAQITASGLVQSVQFVGDQMTINLVPDAFGSVLMEITANDGTFSVTDSFTLNVAPVPDPPVGNPNFYNVAVGGTLQVLNPAQGVVSNDTDPDPDTFPGTNEKVRVHLPSVTQPARGTLEMNEDGTFVYTNTSGQAGDTDTFTYRPIDPTGLVGNVTTVTLNIGQSLYQNPIPGMNADVNADGRVTPLDALLILNLLAANRSAEVLVSSLTTAPPPFYDVNGDGRIQPLDALLVILEIARQNRAQLGNAEGELASPVASATSTVFAAVPLGLPEIEPAMPPTDEPTFSISEDAGTAADPAAFAFEDDDPNDSLIDQLSASRSSTKSGEELSEAADEALLSWIDTSNL